MKVIHTAQKIVGHCGWNKWNWLSLAVAAHVGACKNSTYDEAAIYNIHNIKIKASNTGHTQKKGAVLIVFTIKTAPFFCVCTVYVDPVLL
jgi:hypothetical protein